jgi:uncharacterized membrane protein
MLSNQTWLMKQLPLSLIQPMMASVCLHRQLSLSHSTAQHNAWIWGKTFAHTRPTMVGAIAATRLILFAQGQPRMATAVMILRTLLQVQSSIGLAVIMPVALT